MLRKVISSAQANLPWAVLEAEGNNCRLSLSFEEPTGEIIELGVSHKDILYAPIVLGQVVNKTKREVRMVFVYDKMSAPIDRAFRVTNATQDLYAFCKECEHEGLFTIVE